MKRAVAYGSLFTTNKVYVTNRRVIYRDLYMLGLKANIVSMLYEDIANIILKKGAFSTEIFLKPRYYLDIKLPAVDKKEANEIFALIQKGIRGELPNQRKRDTSSIINELRMLTELKEKGAINEEEFQRLKDKLLENGFKPL